LLCDRLPIRIFQLVQRIDPFFHQDRQRQQNQEHAKDTNRKDRAKGTKLLGQEDLDVFEGFEFF